MKKTPKQPKKMTQKTLRHQFEYADFIQWIAMPKSLRSPKTQRELARKFGLGEDTLSDWKKREGFWEETEQLRKSWGKERTPNVMLALYNRAVKSGDPSAVRLWYEIVEETRFNEKDITVNCAHCALFTKYEEMSDEELDKELKKGEAFFKKQ